MSWYVCGCCQDILDGDDEPSETRGGIDLVCPECVAGFEETEAEDRAYNQQFEERTGREK